MDKPTLSDYTKAFIIARYSAIEAGYVNDPADKGGETNHGITAALAQSYLAQLKARFNWDGTMLNLSKEAAAWLYDVEFWGKLLLDKIYAIHPLLADKLFDIAINGGKKRAVTFLQEFLNVNNNQGKLYPDMVVDGGMGGTTLSCLNGYLAARGRDGVKVLLHSLISRQVSYYIDISVGREKNERYTYGWLTRAYNSAEEYARLGVLYGA